MKRTAIILLCLLMVAAFAAPAFSQDNGKPASYSVSNPNHDQALGGKSQHASQGLQKAATRSEAVQSGTIVVQPPPKKDG